MTSRAGDGSDRGRGPVNTTPVALPFDLDSLPVELDLSLTADVDDVTLVHEVMDAIADCDALRLIEKPTISGFLHADDDRVVCAWVRTFGCTPEHALNEVMSRLVRCWGGAAGRVCA